MPFFSPLRPVIAQPFFIMLDPAGDAKHTGRTIDDSYERGLTFQCAEALKKALEERYPVRVVLTRFTGETLEPLQNAHFANRLNVDLYISIHFYQSEQPLPQLSIYRYSHGNDFVTQKTDLAWHPYDQAYHINVKTTKSWAQQISIGLSAYKQYMDCRGIFAMPFKPLQGIVAPALAFEIGLKKETDWRSIIDPIISSLQPIITQGPLARNDS
jgi:N-acetylmuramoyl-L-alanine amidase